MPAPFVVVERNLLIPLPDGAHLAADLYRPAGEGPWTTSRTTRTAAADAWTSRR